MGWGGSDKSATVGIRRDDGGGILVLKVWREPAFRARITVDCPGSDASAQTVLATTEKDVIDYVRNWLGGTAST